MLFFHQYMCIIATLDLNYGGLEFIFLIMFYYSVLSKIKYVEQNKEIKGYFMGKYPLTVITVLS